jgi:hypothetical protein
MPSTDFSNGTVIEAAWLNEVDDFVFNTAPRDIVKTVEQYGVVGGGTYDDTSLLQAAIDQAYTDGVTELRLTNINGYRITDTITQPWGLKISGVNTRVICYDVPADGRPAWILDYRSWTDNLDRWRPRVSLEGILFLGHASPADNTWTASLNGISSRSYHTIIEKCTITGFDKAISFAQTDIPPLTWLSWQFTLRDSTLSYNQYGFYSDFSSVVPVGGSGAGILLDNCAVTHNDYNFDNYAGEITLRHVSSDSPTKMHVKRNITQLAGAELGFMRWVNSRMEGGGVAGTAWVDNDGEMSWTDSFILERSAGKYTFNNDGIIHITGGTYRQGTGTYLSTGTGVVVQDGPRPITDFVNVLIDSNNSGILNNDLATGTTDGFSVTTGALATFTNVADASFLLAGRCLNLVNTAVASVVSSTSIELDQSKRTYRLTFKGKNANATAVAVTLKQYNRAGFLLNSVSGNIPIGGTVFDVYMSSKKYPSGAYLVVEIALSAAQLSQVRVSDFYLGQW